MGKIDTDSFCDFICERYCLVKEDIELTSDFKDFGIDSLAIFSLIDDIEEQFGITIDVEDMTEINTPEKLLQYINCER